MKRVFGLETEYGITVRRCRECRCRRPNRSSSCGAIPSTARLMKWDYELEDPHRDARGFRARELLQDTDESAYYEIDKKPPAELRGNQKRSRAVEWRALLQRPRASGIFDAGMHHAAASSSRRTKRANASWRSARGAEIRSCRTGFEVRLYKNNTDFRRPQLRLPRQLPDATRCRMGPDRRRHAAVSRHAPNFRRRGQDGHRS